MPSPDALLLKQLQVVWPAVKAHLERHLLVTMTALVDAVENDTVRLLQGRALAYRTLLNLPNELATLASADID